MSIILEGIDLPKEGTLTFRITRHGKAYEITNNGCYIKGTETEAIQIPKGHGRLIDAKVFADTINKAIQDGTFTSKSIWEWIGDAPTILEAEE